MQETGGVPWPKSKNLFKTGFWVAPGKKISTPPENNLTFENYKKPTKRIKILPPIPQRAITRNKKDFKMKIYKMIEQHIIG